MCVCIDCWKFYDSAQVGAGFLVGQPTKAEDDEQVSRLREEGRRKLISKATFGLPPQWWPIGIAQHPDNIYASPDALNARLLGMDSRVAAYTMALTAPTPAL